MFCVFHKSSLNRQRIDTSGRDTRRITACLMACGSKILYIMRLAHENSVQCISRSSDTGAAAFNPMCTECHIMRMRWKRDKQQNHNNVVGMKIDDRVRYRDIAKQSERLTSVTATRPSTVNVLTLF